MQLKAIIFDWAGTVVDYGCLCPLAAFQTAFGEAGLTLAADEIQQFMGLHKRDHIAALLALPPVLAQWQAVHGRPPEIQDIDGLYRSAEREMLETVAESASPTPGVFGALELARRNALKVGSTTGYTSPLMKELVPAAARHGYAPEYWIAADQVSQGRPWPWMIFKNMEQLKVCPPCAVVKVGDTVSDIAEANNAGVWSVAVVESSSLVGKSELGLAALPEKDRHRVVLQAGKKLAAAGAHFVINNLSELAGALDQIEHRLANGQTPPRLFQYGTKPVLPLPNGISAACAEPIG